MRPGRQRLAIQNVVAEFNLIRYELVNHKTQATAARYSRLNLAAREKLADAVLAGVR
jgi:hypothetical protein